jgi:hypothetical protein
MRTLIIYGTMLLSIIGVIVTYVITTPKEVSEADQAQIQRQIEAMSGPFHDPALNKVDVTLPNRARTPPAKPRHH